MLSVTWRLENERDWVGLVVRLDGDDVVVGGALEYLGHAGEIDAEREVAIASVVLEAFALEHERDERHVRAVHGLQAHAAARAVPRRLVEQVLDGLHHFLQKRTFDQTRFEHLRFSCVFRVDLNKRVSVLFAD